jgi:hypothetical protein
VIGYRQRADAHFNGAMNQGFGVSRPSEPEYGCVNHK